MHENISTGQSPNTNCARAPQIAVSVVRKQDSTSKELRDADRCLSNQTPKTSEDRAYRTTERKQRVCNRQPGRTTNCAKTDHEASQVTSKEPSENETQGLTTQGSNITPEVTTTRSHEDKAETPPKPEANDHDVGPDSSIMHLTTKSSAFISSNYEDAHREHSIYVNTLDAEGNPEDVEKMESPKIVLMYQKHSYKSGLSETY
jgi:hypothetical protein